MLKYLAALPNNFIYRLAASAMTFALTLGAAYGVTAQSSVDGVPNAMQGFSKNRDQPIQIEAAKLEIRDKTNPARRDKTKQATFSGSVKVVQGDTTMTSKTLVVFFDSNSAAAASAPTKTKGAVKASPLRSATPGPGGSSSIQRLEARGDVRVTQKDQVVTGKTAVFDTKINLITMLGGVVLSQCMSVLRGDRLLVDMTTGDSRVESDSGKVQGLFNRPSGSVCGTSSAVPGRAPSK